MAPIPSHSLELFCIEYAARKEEADRIENQWHITGEELDCVLRDIQRLEKKLAK